MKIAIILGTRPEIIKMSPIIKECQKERLNFFILHTNQHYANNLDRVFFEELKLPKPKYNLKVGSGTHAEEAGKMLIEAVFRNLKLAKRKSKILERLDLKPRKYPLLTVHRFENTDKKEILKDILKGMELIYKEFNLSIIYPVHPRTKKKMNEFQLKIPRGTRLVEPVGFLDFLQLEVNARLVLSDSGGVQEESCILKIPCVTLRDNTERPETLKIGSNSLSGTNPRSILEGVCKMINKRINWKNPFGNGKSGKKIIKIITTSMKHDIKKSNRSLCAIQH